MEDKKIRLDPNSARPQQTDIPPTITQPIAGVSAPKPRSKVSPVMLLLAIPILLIFSPMLIWVGGGLVGTIFQSQYSAKVYVEPQFSNKYEKTISSRFKGKFTKEIIHLPL